MARRESSGLRKRGNLAVLTKIRMAGFHAVVTRFTTVGNIPNIGSDTKAERIKGLH